MPELTVDPTKIKKSRASMDFFGKLMPVARGVVVRQQKVGGVECEIHQPNNAPANRVLIYFHGGGYSLGSPRTHRHIVSRLASEAALRAVVPDYSKSPEAPYPAPIEDAVAVYKAILDQGIKPANVFLAGDSAGGNLVLVTLLRLKSLGLSMPAAACCISPWTDLTVSGNTINTKTDTDHMLSGTLLNQFADNYCLGLGQGARRDQPGLSPLFADLSGLPPLLIQVGSEEVLLDDALRFTEKAEAAGVKVSLQVWEKMQHVWHLLFLFVKDGKLAISEMAHFLDQSG